MHYLVGLIGGWLASKLTRTVVIAVVNGLVLAAYVVIFTYFIFVMIQFHNLITTLIESVGNSSGDDILDKMFGLLSCIGFTDALYQSLPIITTSLTTLLLSVFHQISLKFYARFRVLIVDVVK